MSIEAFVKRNNKQSNYEVLKHRAAQLVAEQDLKASADRMGLVCDDTHVYVKLFDLSCRVRRTDGFAECSETDSGEYHEADFNTAMILFDLLGYAAKGAHTSGEFALLESFSKVQNARSYAGEGMFAETEAIFDRQFEKLRPACEALGGTPFGKGDASYRIPLFRDLDVVISFWRSDDEFPASLGVRFDCNTLQYLHYETMWYAAFGCIHRIMAKFSETAPLKTVEVVAAAIVKNEKVFATQRGYGEFKDGWEFPGGKIEPGETREEALVREIKEELDTDIAVTRFIGTVACNYPKFHLTMHCFICEVVSGTLELKEHEAAKWLGREELDTVHWLPADVIAVQFLKNAL